MNLCLDQLLAIWFSIVMIAGLIYIKKRGGDDNDLGAGAAGACFSFFRFTLRCGAYLSREEKKAQKIAHPVSTLQDGQPLNKR